MLKIIREITPRFKDIDFQGHVNNAVYFTYMEIIRSEYYFELRNKINEDYRFIIAHQEIDHLKPIKFGDKIRIEMWVSRFGIKSWDFVYIMTNIQGETVSKSKTTQVSYDYKKNVSIDLPLIVKKQLMSIYIEDK